MSKKNGTEKLKTLAKNIQKNPDDSFSKFALALEFNKMDRYEKAKVLFESIRNNDPGYVGVYYHLGKTYELLGMEQQALLTYKEGIEVASANKGEERTVSELKEALAELKMEME